MVIIVLVAYAIAIISFIMSVENYRKLKNLAERVGTLALKVVNTQAELHDVDDSAGLNIRNLQMQVDELQRKFDEFRRDYGEAAIESMRENARAEKAWADGINGIMSYGARYQDGGNST